MTRSSLTVSRRIGALALIVGAILSACSPSQPASSGTASPATAATRSAAPTSAPTAAPTPTSPPYPTKAITIIVPFAAGGPADLSGRLVAEYASSKWGQPVQVVNVAGASGITGSLQALQAPADGYTMLLDSSATSSVLDAVTKSLPFKIEDRVYAGRISTDYYYFVAHTGTGWNTLKDAMDAARQNPEGFVWGAAAAGSSVQFLGLQLLDAAGVPYSKTKMLIFEGGNAPNVQALAGGNVKLIPTVFSDAQSLVASGRGKILAAASRERTKDLPNVTSTAELGFPAVSLGTWQAVAGRKDLPATVVAAWEKLLSDAKSDPAFLAKAATAKRTIAFVPGKEWGEAVIKERDSLLPLALSTGLRPK